MSDDEQSTAFASLEEEAKFWKSKARSWKSVADEREDVVISTQAEMQDFMESSKELEKEMDREITASNRKISDLQTKNEALRGEKDEWKTKYQKSLAEHNSALAIMQKEVGQMRDSHEAFKNKLRDMELDNDDLENAERMVASSLADMEGKYNRAIERTALLEEELVEKSRLEEELQRLRDENRDLQEELSVRNDAASRVPSSRSATPAEIASSGRQSALDLRLEDLILDRTKPQSNGERSARSKPAELSSSRHERRGSLNTRMSGAMPNMDSTTSYTDRRSAIRRDTAASTISPVRRAVNSRSTARGPGAGPAQVGSMKLMANLIARMQTVEGKLQSARVINKVPDADKSSIPRPSSRLGQSTGPGVNSPGLPRVTSRQSFDGRSSIPVPANGFSKSTTRRPSSRMSTHGDTLTPPSSNAPLPSRGTPPRHKVTSPSSPPYPPRHNRSPELQQDTSHAAYTMPRRSSVSSGIGRPRTSGIATAVRSSNSSLPPGAAAKPSGSTAQAGPPNSWRTTGGVARPRSSTIGSQSSK